VNRHTTIEVDEELVERAREVLGETTTRGTVEEALRRVTEGADHERRAANQRRYLQQLPERVDMSVLASEEMWR
jgi:Arc/MetJ family transcription regulator